MKTVKKLSITTVLSFTLAILLFATGCSHSPEKPEWVQNGAERDTSHGMIRHFGTGTGPDKDTALFNARQNAIQATEQECAGIALKRTVPRKTWIEPVYENGSKIISYYQGHAVVEVSEEDCEAANKPGPNQVSVIGENERVHDQQDTYDRVLKKKLGLPDDYYLKERAIAATYATREDVAAALHREELARQDSERELLQAVTEQTGVHVFGKAAEGPGEGDEELGHTPQKDLEATCAGQNRQIGLALNHVISEHGMDRTHPATVPWRELQERNAKRCNEIYDHKRASIDWNFGHEYNEADRRSSNIENGMYAQRQNVGGPSPADDPRLFPNTNVRADGVPNSNIDAPVSPAAPKLPTAQPQAAAPQATAPQAATESPEPVSQEVAQSLPAAAKQAARMPSSLAGQ